MNNLLFRHDNSIHTYHYNDLIVVWKTKKTIVMIFWFLFNQFNIIWPVPIFIVVMIKIINENPFFKFVILFYLIK